jgi:flavin-dependent dehydrogenase
VKYFFSNNRYSVVLYLQLCLVVVLLSGLVTGALAEGVLQSARNIPVIRSVDVVVIGGSVAGVSAATAAAEKGADVFLAAPRPYLGEDLCATLRFRLEPGRTLETQIERDIFASGMDATPLHIKRTLDKALLNAGVDFLFGSYVTEILRDAQNQPCGVVIANRAGRQAVIAKVIIDATDRAWTCRIAGAVALSWSGGETNFRRVVITPGDSKDKIAVEHELSLPMPDLHFASFAEAEQAARDLTFTEKQFRASETMFQVPSDPIVCRRNAAEWSSMHNPATSHFQPADVDRMYVLSGCAGMPRDVAADLLQPASMAQIGKLVGIAAAAEAGRLPEPRNVRLSVHAATGETGGDIREILRGARPTDSGLSTVPSARCSVPILADYDVVIVGGGTSGAPAAVAAARRGARVLVLEYQEGLGGVSTLGLIGRSYHGLNVGFSKEVPFPNEEYTIAYKMEWYRREIRLAGGDIWFGVLGCGAWIDGHQVRGVVVCTPEGRVVISADVVIDATGNADVAIAAGADYLYGATEAGDIGLQGTGMPRRPLRGSYVNTDYLLVDESDMVDVWRTLVSTRQMMETTVYDIGTLIQNRERRRIVGDHVMSYMDQIAGRTYPDAIVYSSSDYDSHGYPTSRFFGLLPHDDKSRRENHPAPGGSCFTPYRCLLPRGLEGILVTGLGISMERDATALMRMQLDIQNQGYAAGVAASMASRAGVTPRRIDIHTLQQHLVEKGNLPESVLNHEDSFPLSTELIKQAVINLRYARNPVAAGHSLAVILTHREVALPLLRQAYNSTDEEAGKLIYAKVLGFFGKNEALPTLLESVTMITDWEDRILQGIMAEYAHLPTPQDGIILALGYAGDWSVTPALLELLARLDASVTLSHHRSLALALENLRNPAAAQPLAQLLNKPGMRGHAMTQLEPVYDREMDQRRRLGALREIVLARALYRCGDYQDVGKTILREYQNELRGLFARHANAVLSSE